MLLKNSSNCSESQRRGGPAWSPKSLLQLLSLAALLSCLPVWLVAQGRRSVSRTLLPPGIPEWDSHPARPRLARWFPPAALFLEASVEPAQLQPDPARSLIRA